MNTRHIGIAIFLFCAALLIEIERHLYLRSPEEVEREQRLTRRDFAGLLPSVRYYIAGVGVLGLAIFFEDKISEVLRRKRIEKGFKPRESVTLIQVAGGTTISDPTLDEVREAAHAVFRHEEDEESYLANGHGWVIRARKSGLLTLENVSAGFGPWWLKVESPEQLHRYWLLLKSNSIEEIRDDDWRVGMPL